MNPGRAGRRGSASDGGQLLLLAGFVLVMMFVVTSITLSEISSIEAGVSRSQSAPVLDEFSFIRAQTNETMRSLVTSDTTNSSFNDTFDGVEDSFAAVENSKGYDLVMALGGGSTIAPSTEAEDFAGGGHYDHVSFDGVRAFCEADYDGVNDGIIWFDDEIKGFVAYIYLSDHESQMESTVLFATNTENDDTGTCGTWVADDNATSNNLSGVTTTAYRAWAVGGNGHVIERQAEEWVTRDSDGPGGANNNLHGIDDTADGERFWVVGASGTVGEYWAENGTLVEDHTNPGGLSTATFNDVAVAGNGDAATIFIATDAGDLIRSSDGGDTWTDDPHSFSSSLQAVDLHSRTAGHAVNDQGDVYETTDGGSNWDEIPISGTPTTDGIDSDGTGAGDVWVAGGGETVWRYEGGGSWSENLSDSGSDTLLDVEVSGDEGLAVGEGGSVYAFDGEDWTEETVATGNQLDGVVLGAPDIVVGDGPTIFTR